MLRVAIVSWLSLGRSVYGSFHQALALPSGSHFICIDLPTIYCKSQDDPDIVMCCCCSSRLELPLRLVRREMPKRLPQSLSVLLGSTSRHRSYCEHMMIF